MLLPLLAKSPHFDLLEDVYSLGAASCPARLWVKDMPFCPDVRATFFSGVQEVLAGHAVQRIDLKAVPDVELQVLWEHRPPRSHREGSGRSRACCSLRKWPSREKGEGTFLQAAAC